MRENGPCVYSCTAFELCRLKGAAHGFQGYNSVAGILDYISFVPTTGTARNEVYLAKKEDHISQEIVNLELGAYFTGQILHSVAFGLVGSTSTLISAKRWISPFAEPDQLYTKL